MARQRWVYRTDESGVCRAIPCDVIPRSYWDTVPVLEERVRQDLHALECEHGSRFNGIGEFSTNTLKRVWVDNVARDAEFDRRRDNALQRARERVGYG